MTTESLSESWDAIKVIESELRHWQRKGQEDTEYGGHDFYPPDALRWVNNARDWIQHYVRVMEEHRAAGSDVAPIHDLLVELTAEMRAFMELLLQPRYDAFGIGFRPAQDPFPESDPISSPELLPGPQRHVEPSPASQAKATRMPASLRDVSATARDVPRYADEQVDTLNEDARRYVNEYGNPKASIGALCEAQQIAVDLRGLVLHLRRQIDAHRHAEWDVTVAETDVAAAHCAVERLCATVARWDPYFAPGIGTDFEPSPIRVLRPADMDEREAWEAWAIANQAELDRQSRFTWRVAYAVMLLTFVAGCWGILRFASSDHGNDLEFGLKPGLALVLMDLLALAFVATERAKASPGWAMFRSIWMGSAAGHAAYRVGTPEHLRSGRLEGAATSAGAYAGYQHAQRANARHRATGQYPPKDKTLRAEWQRQRAFHLQAERDRAAGDHTPPGEDDFS